MADEPIRRPSVSEALLKLKELSEDHLKELLSIPETKQEPADHASGKTHESESDGMEEKLLAVVVSTLGSDTWGKLHRDFSKAMCQSLPSVNALPGFLEQEMPAKIDMLSCDLSSWSYFTQEMELIRKLFTLNELAPCTQFKDHVMEFISHDHSVAHFASGFVGNLIEFVFENGKITRDWSHSSSRNLRPSAFRLVWREIYVLRGEELGSNEDMMLG